MWSTYPYLNYEAAPDVKQAEFDSWWEITGISDKTQRSTSRERAWEGYRFESRIEAKRFFLKHKHEGETIEDIDIRVKTRNK